MSAASQPSVQVVGGAGGSSRAAARRVLSQMFPLLSMVFHLANQGVGRAMRRGEATAGASLVVTVLRNETNLSHRSAHFSTPAASVVGDEEWLDVDEAARYLDLPNRTIRRRIRDGELEAVGSPARVRRQDLDDFIHRCRIKPGELVHRNAYPNRAGKPRTTSKGRPDRRFGPRSWAQPLSMAHVCHPTWPSQQSPHMVE